MGREVRRECFVRLGDGLGYRITYILYGVRMVVIGCFVYELRQGMACLLVDRLQTGTGAMLWNALPRSPLVATLDGMVQVQATEGGKKPCDQAKGHLDLSRQEMEFRSGVTICSPGIETPMINCSRFYPS